MRIRAVCALLLLCPASLHAQNPPRISLVEDLRIDGARTDLVPFGFLAVRSDGAIAVNQAQDHVVRIFDAAGRSTGTLGRAGSGPGEFGLTQRIGWTGDSLWVFDHGGRVNVFTPERRSARMFTLATLRSNQIGGSLGAAVLAVCPDGTLIVSANESINGVAAAFGFRPRNWILRVTREGVAQHTIARLPIDRTIVQSSEGGYHFVGLPFEVSPPFAVSSDGNSVAILSSVSTGGTPSFRITMHDGSGRILSARDYPFALEPISERQRDSAIAEISKRLRNPKFTATLEDKRTKALMATSLPPVIDMKIGPDGSLWLALQRKPDGRPWLVLDAAGNTRGIVTVSPRTVILAADGLNAWASESDADGIQSIVRYRVVLTR